MQPVQWHHLNSRLGFPVDPLQNRTEELLLDHACAMGLILATVSQSRRSRRTPGWRTGVEAVGLNGISATLTARYVVGADGGARAAARVFLFLLEKLQPGGQPVLARGDFVT